MPVFFIRIGQFAPRMAPRRRYNSPVRWPTPTHDQGAVCTAAGVNPDHYRVWAHEGPEATAPATAGSTVAVTSWAVYRLPPQHLEAVLARELAHRLAMPRTPSLLLCWLAVPARMMGRAIVLCLKHRVMSIFAKIAIGFLLIGVVRVWMFLGFGHYVVFVVVAAGSIADAAKLLGGGSGPAVQTATAGWAAGFLAGVAMYFQTRAARIATSLILAAFVGTAALLALAARTGIDQPGRTVAGTLMFGVVYLAIGALVGATVRNPVNGTVSSCSSGSWTCSSDLPSAHRTGSPPDGSRPTSSPCGWSTCHPATAADSATSAGHSPGQSAHWPWPGRWSPPQTGSPTGPISGSPPGRIWTNSCPACGWACATTVATRCCRPCWPSYRSSSSGCPRSSPKMAT